MLWVWDFLVFVFVLNVDLSHTQPVGDWALHGMVHSLHTQTKCYCGVLGVCVSRVWLFLRHFPGFAVVYVVFAVERARKRAHTELPRPARHPPNPRALCSVNS